MGAKTAPPLDVSMLGELLVSVGDRPVAIPGRQQRVLLMSLALRANQAASPERLIDALWGPAPPASAAAGLRVSVSKLRRVLESAGAPDVLETRPGGYVLLLQAGRTDLARFEQMMVQARATEDHGEREALLAQALSLWRGPAFEGLDHDPVAVAELIRLQELRQPDRGRGVFVDTRRRQSVGASAGRAAVTRGRLTHRHGGGSLARRRIWPERSAGQSAIAVAPAPAWFGSTARARRGGFAADHGTGASDRSPPLRC